MGQAFDSQGNVLGEAFGFTKAEVFDKLNEAHPDAVEVRITTLAPTNDGVSSPMPRWKCHKEVGALQIAGIRLDADIARVQNRETDGSALLDFWPPFSYVRVDAEYMQKHKPEVGGYYVVYDDGYASWSPAQAFESGYTRIK